MSKKDTVKNGVTGKGTVVEGTGSKPTYKNTSSAQIKEDDRNFPGNLLDSLAKLKISKLFFLSPLVLYGVVAFSRGSKGVRFWDVFYLCLFISIVSFCLHKKIPQKLFSEED